MVYEQPDSLKPVADKWKLEIKTAQHVTRTPAPGATGPLANPRFLEALFSSDSTRDKRNTKAIDVGSNQLAAGRVVQYTPAHQLPFAEVKDKVRQQLAATQAAALAAQARRRAPGRSCTRRAGERARRPTLVVSRAQPRDLPRPLLDAILKAPVRDAAGVRRRVARRPGLRGGQDHQDGGPRSGRRRSGAGDGAVRAGLGGSRGAGVLRRAEVALQGERQRSALRATAAASAPRGRRARRAR